MALQTSFDLRWYYKEFSGDPVVRLHTFTAEGTSSSRAWGTKIPQTERCGQKKEEEEDGVTS